MTLASWFGRLSTLIVLAGSICVFGQTRVNNSGNGGINIIRGQIYSPGNTRIDGQITVRLQSMSQGELTLLTDQSGGFEFRALSPGTYYVVVDAGDTFDTFREAVTIDPNVQLDPNARVPPTPKTFTVPVYLHLRQGQSEKASVLDARMAAAPRDAVKHYEKGIDLIREGKADLALAEFRAAVQMYPALTPASVQMGSIYLRTGRISDAVDVLGKAVELDPTDFDANVDYGAALFANHDYSKAETYLLKASQLNGTAVTPHYYLGLLYFQTNAYDKAQTELESAKRLKGDKNFPLVHRYLGEVYRARKMDKEAVAELETYLKIAPNAKDAASVRQTVADLKSKTN